MTSHHGARLARPLGAALTGVLALTVSAVVSAAAQPSADPPDTNPHAAAAAVGMTWLTGEFIDGALDGPVAGFPDYGVTIDAFLALTATGVDPAAEEVVIARLAANVRSFNSYDDYDEPGVRLAGATAKLLLAAAVAGADPADFGGYDLRQETLDLVAGADAGAEQGRIRDLGIEDTSNTFAQSLAVVGLARTGGVDQAVVDYLVRQQCASGGFVLLPVPGATCDETASPLLDPDATAMAIQALLVARDAGVAGAGAAADLGTEWLAGQQRPDGSFGGVGSTEGSNTNSTGLAGQALAGAGET